MKAFFVSICILLVSINCFSQHQANLRLKVSQDGHSLQYEDGRSFFWLGDTGWQMLFRLNKHEIEQYLENRKRKGFNVIQAVALDDSTDPMGPNRYGDLPLIGYDLDKPNDQYFKLIDWTLKLAQKKGLYVALVTTWAGNVVKNWGKPNALFNEMKAYRYGLFLGKRYSEYPNLIWVVGGDRPAFDASNDWRPMWRNLVKGLREGGGRKILVTYHPAGEASSTDYWKQDSLLDFNMIQSGHRKRDLEAWSWIRRDYQMQPAKPVIDGEPNYEDHPINWQKENGYFNAYDVRKQLYRTVFSGAAGVTYGNHAIWQFYTIKEKPFAYPDRFWQDALDRPGAFQAGYLKNLMIKWASATRIPDQSLIKNNREDDSLYITAFRDQRNKFAMLYLPVGKRIEVDASFLKSMNLIVTWFNPQSGKYELKQRLTYNGTPLSVEPPTLGTGNDWVLIVSHSGDKP